MNKLFLTASVSAAIAQSAAIAAESATPGSAGGPPACPAAKPNIVFIMADDHGRQAISSYGSVTVQTPRIDALARDGMRFDKACASVALCAPSRAVLLTGKYSHVNGFLRNGDRFNDAQQTFPKLLRQAGYQTAMVGKWHLETQPTGFDYYSVLPGHGQYHDCPFLESGAAYPNKGRIRKGYVTDVITDLSLQWLDGRDKSKPFCLMLHHKAPHAPLEPAPRHRNLFANTTFPEPPTLLDDYKGRAPEAIAENLFASRLRINNYPELQEEIKKTAGMSRDDATRHMYQVYMRGYARLIASLDENVGRVLDYLDKNGLAPNTVMVYTSDNGFFNGEHGFFNKQWMYEPSMRIPLLVRYPGKTAAGAVSGDLVSMLDIAPTLLDAAGVKAPGDMQGRSLKPLLEGQTPADWRDAVFYHYYPQYHVPEQFGVRSAKAKLVYYRLGKIPNMPKLLDIKNSAPFWEYFDLAADPQEMNNLYHDPARQPEIAALKAKLRELAAQYKDQRAIKQLDEKGN